MPPSHYEARLEHDLGEVQATVASLGRRVEQALRSAMQALLQADKDLAYRTILEDNPINRDSRALDRRCHAFIARHLPSAGHLRYISSVIRLNIGLERIGDYAVTISREAAWLPAPPQGTIREGIRQMSDEAIHMLNEAMKGFNEQNADLAEGTKRMAAEVDRTFATAFSHLVEAGQADAIPTKGLLASLAILSTLDRVSDQAKNICEDTLFAVTGEMKKTKRFKVLFLDHGNGSLSHMARAIAQKRFPESGYYTCAGVDAPDALAPGYVRFMENHGFDMAGSTPLPYNLLPEELLQYHVIVALNHPVQRLVREVPFHTIALRWDVPPPSSPGAGPEEQAARYLDIYRHLATLVSDLMHTLHGEEAA